MAICKFHKSVTLMAVRITLLSEWPYYNAVCETALATYTGSVNLDIGYRIVQYSDIPNCSFAQLPGRKRLYTVITHDTFPSFTELQSHRGFWGRPTLKLEEASGPGVLVPSDLNFYAMINFNWSFVMNINSSESSLTMVITLTDLPGWNSITMKNPPNLEKVS